MRDPPPASVAGAASGRTFRWTLLFCLAAAAVLRVAGVWANRYLTDPDAGIVALMAKHVAEGGPWPVFFYGQAYMGSLEPLASALCCRLFGVDGFTVNLGTALVALLVLPVLYGWARDAGGRVAGLVAVALCVVGPTDYFVFQYNPRGGYMMTLLLGLLVMWGGGRLAQHWWRREAVPVWACPLLGLVAGLAWWTNVGVIAALAATALTLLIAARGRPSMSAVALGLAGFFIGSLPFWLYNLQHDWASLSMLQDTESLHWRRGVEYLGQRYTRLMTGPGPTWAQPVLLILPLALAALGLALAGAASLRRRTWNPHVVIILIFLALSVTLFVRSRFATFNTVRYLIPWVPPVAVLIGIALQGVHARFGRCAALAPLALLLAMQSGGPRDLLRALRAQPERRAFVESLESFLQARGITACYGHFLFHVNNFHTRERIRFSGFPAERVTSIARDAELAARIAMLDNHGKIAEFLQDGGGRGETGRVGSRRIDYGFVPPPAGRVALGPEALAGIRDDQGLDVAGPLTDLDAGTEWFAPLAREEDRTLTVTFAGPRVVRMVRFWGLDPQGWPRVLTVEYRVPGEATWRTHQVPRPLSRLFWSGPRLYHDGVGFRAELHLPDLEMEALRLVGGTGGHTQPDHWAMGELQLFGPAPPPPDQEQALGGLRAVLTEESLNRLYSDRWVANQLALAGPSGLALQLDPRAFPDSPLREQDPMRLTPGTGLLVLESEAAASRAVLASHGVAVSEQPVGPWILMRVDAASAPPAGGEGQPPLRWLGFGCVRESPPADSQAEVSALPLTTPVRAQFEGGRIELLGISLATNRVAPGGSVTVDYVWRCDPGATPARWAVFVHVCRGRRVAFQADHRLLTTLSAYTLSRQTGPVFRREQHLITIPPDAEPGDYTVRLGLYDPKGRARVNAVEASVRARAVYLPVVLTVVAPAGAD